MDVVELHAFDAGVVDLVGGKAAGLHALIELGEQVPPGFCVTTKAYRRGVVPTAEIAAAYERLAAATVAVRSSATAEDLPQASFAGQQDTFLDVSGADAVVDAVAGCWRSLHNERAVAYREHAGIDGDVEMAVVVQRMVEPAVAGVLFTANPVTGRRTEMVVDAVAGHGRAVVDGTIVPDHYVLDGTRHDTGCLRPEQLDRLEQVGDRLQRHFGCPQDIEWAIDRQGVLWLLQARPITTLYPLPPDTGRPTPRVYLELASNFQGVVRPFTPMGTSVLRLGATRMASSFGMAGAAERDTGVVDIGGRPYLDLTDVVRDQKARNWLPRILATDFGPRVQAVLERVLADPRFAPSPGRTPRRSGGPPAALLRQLPGAVAGVTRALARPAAARALAFRQVEEVRRATADSTAGTAAQRLRVVRESATFLWPKQLLWPMLAGILAAAAPVRLLAGIATEAEVRVVLGGMPHNVTTEMDLALWRLSRRATAHRDLLLHTPPDELAAKYLAGGLPDIGLAAFLDSYGHRAVAEIDIGVPRWEEDPTPVFAAIANYLRVTDEQQAPDLRFARAAAAAEAKLAELTKRARRRPVRGRLAGFCLRRARALAGLRELGKFAGLYPLRQTRRQLLAVGAELAERGVLECAADVMFLTLDEAHAADRDGAPRSELVAEHRAAYRQELRRRRIPVALLSDGTDVEAAAAPPAAGADTLVGMPAAPGTATGPARVLTDPADAHLEPGEVLVAPSTDPGWTPLFLTASALVTETGAAIAHGPTVAREYGIPAVICVPDATTLIETGRVVTVDGATGTVTFD